MKKEHTYKRESKTYIPKVHTNSIRTYIHTQPTHRQNREREEKDKREKQNKQRRHEKRTYIQEGIKTYIAKEQQTLNSYIYTHRKNREREKKDKRE